MVLTVNDAKKLTVPRLKEELTKRGLDNTGNKPELLARLTESINQAAEDLILSDAGVAADHHLLNDDILNDDLLAEPSIDGDEDADKLLASVVEPTASTEAPEKEEEKAAEEPKKEVVLTEKKEEGGVEEAQRARAIRFGLPLTSEVLASDTSKSARAQRFGLPEDAKRLSSDDAKAKRAERFGITAAAATEEVPAATDEKLAARAARFGLPVGGPKGEQAEKLAARAKRFGNQTEDDEETKAKKQARLERFGAK